MSSHKQMCLVLLRDRLRLQEESVRATISTFPGTERVDLAKVEGKGALLHLGIGGRTYSVISLPMAPPVHTFERALAHPAADTLRPMIENSQAHLAVAYDGEASSMGDAVMIAATIQQLALMFGGLGDPLGAFWANSERLCDWAEFQTYADDVRPAFEGADEVDFPSRYWVSIQLTRAGEKYGGDSIGLMPFTGYELEMTPVSWPMDAIAVRMVGAVKYLFDNGPVFQPGETIGASEEEKFRLSKLPKSNVMELKFQTNQSLNKTDEKSDGQEASEGT